MLVSVSQNEVPDGAVRKRAVVQRFFWRYWVLALRKLLTVCRTVGCCVLMPELSSVLEGIPAKFTERSVASAEVASATSLRPDGLAGNTGLATEPAQLPHTVCKQQLSSVFLPHMLHETSICGCHVSGAHSGGTPWALVSAEAVFWNSSLLAVAGLAGLLVPQGESEESWLLGTESPASLIRL